MPLGANFRINYVSEIVKQFRYLLVTSLCDKKMTQESMTFNSLVVQPFSS
jgi:hypothetical protein